MRAALLLLVACGSPERDKPTPTPTPTPTIEARPSCKPGNTICAGDDIKLCEDGTYHRTITSCRGGCREGACIETCGAHDVELIYLVDDVGSLLSFDPRKLPADPFKRIGTLTCDPESRPYSMAIDRSGIAWVVYLTGILYRASIVDAHCLPSAAKVAGTPGGFGMGFVTDGPKATTEKLYATSPEHAQLGTVDLAKLPPAWTSTGSIAIFDGRAPELTGTADGRLYAYTPSDELRGFVREIDRTGAGKGTRWTLPAERGLVGGFAFAFWGDVFYVFVTFNEANEVWAIRRKTGKLEKVLTSEHQIVGAGVSTCAPLLERL